MVKEDLRIPKEFIPLALSLAHTEKPFRDLAHNASKSIYQPGMENARNTLITLATNAANEKMNTILLGTHKSLPRTPQVPDGVPPHQAHIVTAAEQYAQFVTDLSKSGDPVVSLTEKRFYNEPKSLDDSPVVANQSREVLGILGASNILEEYDKGSTHIEIWDSAIKDVRLKLQNNRGAVSIFPIAS